MKITPEREEWPVEAYEAVRQALALTMEGPEWQEVMNCSEIRLMSVREALEIQELFLLPAPPVWAWEDVDTSSSFSNYYFLHEGKWKDSESWEHED
jgi:hypothetical protein